MIRIQRIFFSSVSFSGHFHILCCDLSASAQATAEFLPSSHSLQSFWGRHSYLCIVIPFRLGTSYSHWIKRKKAFSFYSQHFLRSHILTHIPLWPPLSERTALLLAVFTENSPLQVSKNLPPFSTRQGYPGNGSSSNTWPLVPRPCSCFLCSVSSGRFIHFYISLWISHVLPIAAVLAFCLSLLPMFLISLDMYVFAFSNWVSEASLLFPLFVSCYSILLASLHFICPKVMLDKFFASDVA